MRQLPPRRFTLDQAAQHQFGKTKEELAAEELFQQQLRAKNIELELKPKMRELARQMQQHLDAELKKAVERFLGFEVTDPQQVAGRLTHQQPPTEALRDAAQGEACTIYSMDGVPVLRAGAQVLERRGDEIHAFQLVEQLLPEDYKPAAKGGILIPQAVGA